MVNYKELKYKIELSYMDLMNIRTCISGIIKTYRFKKEDGKLKEELIVLKKEINDKMLEEVKLAEISQTNQKTIKEDENGR